MDYLVPKAPADTVAYFIDWSKQLDADGDAIATFDLTVSSGTVVIAPDPTNFGTFLRCVISGGANGELAVLACTVNTVGLQVLTRDIQLYVSTGAEAITPSTATKRTIVYIAFEEIGLAGYEFDATPEEYASALRRLDILMAEWAISLQGLNYNAPPQIGTGNLDDESGLPDDALNATAISLALRIMPAIGKTMSTESRVAYGQAMNALRARYTPKVERQLQAGTPRGAGQKPYGVWYPFGYFGLTGPGVIIR